VRRRTVEWRDPFATVQAGRGMSGAEYVAAMARGDIGVPPFVSVMGYDTLEPGDGTVTITATPDEMHYNAIGTVHGGYAATLLDSVMTLAVMSTLPAGTGCTTLDINVRYVRPLQMETGPVRATATVVRAGSRVATAEGRITDAAGRVYAHGTTACLIFTIDGERDE